MTMTSTAVNPNPFPLTEESYRSPLTHNQIYQLIQAIQGNRIQTNRDGQLHMEAYEVRAHLIRIFGFGGWSLRTLAMEHIGTRAFVHKTTKDDRIDVAYRAHCELVIKTADGTEITSYSEWAVGDAQGYRASDWTSAHDKAIKTAESQALKRCAANLGDQFGLSLYTGREKALAPLVGVTLVRKNLDEVTDEGAAGQTQPMATADVAPEVDINPENVDTDTGEIHDEPQPQAVRQGPPAPGPETPQAYTPQGQKVLNWWTEQAMAYYDKGLEAFTTWANENRADMPREIAARIEPSIRELEEAQYAQR